MNNLQSTKQLKQTPAIMVFDMKYCCIRIHRKTLHMLNDPDFIQFLVNPKDKIIAIRPGKSTNALAERVKWDRINDNHCCCEMYSTSLVYQLQNLLPELDNMSSYRMEGKHFKKENLIAFKMSDARLLNYVESEPVPV